MKTPKRLSLKRPKDRQTIHAFIPNVDRGIVDVIKYVYFKNATYEEVTGELVYGLPFTNEWAVFHYDYRSDWRCSGRTSSSLIEQFMNHEGEFKYSDTYRDFDTAYVELKRLLLERVHSLRERYTDALHKFYRLPKLERPPQ